MTTEASALGIMVRIGARDVRFIDAEHRPRLVVLPPVSPIPHAPEGCLGVSMIDSVIVPVIALGEARHPAVYCEVDDQRALLVGFDAFEAGAFPIENGKPKAFGAEAEPLDLHAHLEAMLRAPQRRREPHHERR